MVNLSMEGNNNMGKGKQVGITMRALVQRINRKLAQQDEVLRAIRGERAKQDLGDYAVINISRNSVSRHDVDVVALAKELDVLKKWERVIEEGK
jgi:hypothetical protein